jgi:hypothetical protein
MDRMDIAPTVHGPDHDRPRVALTELPDEILTAIMLACALRDVEALGAACSALHAVARDDSLWRRLFWRDNGSFYEPSIAMGSWVCDMRTDAPWPDEALPGGMTCEDVRSLLPPDPDPSLPPPFARMRAAGKDYRWLCIAHARRIPQGSASEWPESTFGAVRLLFSELGGRIPCDHYGYVGYTHVRSNEEEGSDILVRGYGTLLVFDAHDAIVGWREGSRTIVPTERYPVLEWGVVVAADKFTLVSRPFDDTGGDTGSTRRRLIHRTARGTVKRDWFEMLGKMYDAFIKPYIYLIRAIQDCPTSHNRDVLVEGSFVSPSVGARRRPANGGNAYETRSRGGDAVRAQVAQEDVPRAVEVPVTDEPAIARSTMEGLGGE